MNEDQVVQQIAYKLRQRTWTVPSGTGEKVFRRESVRITPLADPKTDASQAPFAFVIPGAGEADKDNPAFGRGAVLIRLVAQQPGDRYGERSLVGGNRTSGGSSSKGRGLLEIQRELYAAIKSLGEVGVKVYGRLNTWPRIEDVEGVLGGCLREYAWEIGMTAEPFYHPVSRLTATGGAGSFSATWSIPPDRFDRYKIRAFRSAAGGSAPTYSGGVFSGTEIVLGSDLATSLASGVVAAGTYAISVFAGYDDFCETKAGVYAPSTAQNYSAAASATGIIVT